MSKTANANIVNLTEAQRAIASMLYALPYDYEEKSGAPVPDLPPRDTEARVASSSYENWDELWAWEIQLFRMVGLKIRNGKLIIYDRVAGGWLPASYQAEHLNEQGYMTLEDAAEHTGVSQEKILQFIEELPLKTRRDSQSDWGIGVTSVEPLLQLAEQQTNN